MPSASYKDQVIASSREQFTAERAGVEKVIIEELAASAVAEAPFDARMRKKPVSPAAPNTSTDTPHPPLKATRAPSETSQGAAEGAARPIPRPVMREQVKPPVPRPPVALIARPVQPQKTAEDLKTILRNMTAKTSVEKEKKQTEHQQSLKGALSEVLEKSKQEAVSSKQDNKPFEVSEDKLRDVLKGDI